ncbi:MAG: DUF1254 domain-containing protein [Bacteroidales bacterium]|nr:DUF1254 domain-containing protein [Bacteroidales bacterium]
MKKYIALGLVCVSLIACSPKGEKMQQTDKNTVALEDAKLFGNEKIATDFGTIEIEGTYLTKESIEKLNHQLAVQRAVEVYQWSLGFANFQMWYKGSEEVFGAKHNQFVEYASYREKRGVVTANGTTPYVAAWTDLNEGPLVIELPAGKVAGGVYDFYQHAVKDLGLVGPDKGKGGKYLVIPPGYDESNLNTKGYFLVRPKTNKIMYGIRILAPEAEAIGHIKKGIKVGIYGDKLASAKFIANSNKVFRGHPYRGVKYFELIHEFFQGEPIHPQEVVFYTYMKELGVDPNEPFNPSARQKEILAKGANLGELMCRANQQEPRADETYYPNRSWERLLDNCPLTRWDDENYYIDQANQYYYEAVTISRGMKANQPGFGVTSYLTTKEDSEGNFLNGSNTYKLHLNADIPVMNFWSLVVYSEESRCFIVNDEEGNDMRSTRINSRQKDLHYNEDGSIDLYIGPKAPEGKESNWIQTPEGEGWFPLFRFYGTKQAFFDKTWVINEFEKI